MKYHNIRSLRGKTNNNIPNTCISYKPYICLINGNMEIPKLLGHFQEETMGKICIMDTNCCCTKRQGTLQCKQYFDFFPFFSCCNNVILALNS